MAMNKWETKDNCTLMYKVSCSCGGGDDCDLTVEFDSDIGDIGIVFYKQMQVWNPYRNADNIWEHFLKILHNIKISIKVLFGHRLSFESDIMLQEETHVEDFLQAIQEGQQYMKEFKETHFDKES